jgi:pimeloyl-ACP methyl ester carboxylesterase
LRKLPPEIYPRVLAEWFRPEFYAQAARMLTALPANLKQAQSIAVNVPSLSLHSDYPDPAGTRVEDSGHWIQVDQPAIVAAAVRRLHAIIEQKGV